MFSLPPLWFSLVSIISHISWTSSSPFQPLIFFSFRVISPVSFTRIGNRPCDPQRRRDRGGLHQWAEGTGWAAGASLGRWRNLRALDGIAGIPHLFPLCGPFSSNFSFPCQTLSAITSSEHFYPFLYGTYLVPLLHFIFQSCLVISSSFFYLQGGLARMSSGFFVRPWANYMTSLNLFPYL